MRPTFKPLSLLRQWMVSLLSPDTPAGRVMRPVLRWVGAAVGIFAMGLLAGYVLLYQPAQQENASNLHALRLNRAELETRTTNLSTTTAERDSLLKKLTQSEARLAQSRAENDLLLVFVSVNDARLALAAKEGAAARTAIDQAQAHLARALPTLENLDKTIPALLKARLDLAAKELVIDPAAAQLDLNKLQSDLQTLANQLFKK